MEMAVETWNMSSAASGFKIDVIVWKFLKDGWHSQLGARALK